MEPKQFVFLMGWLGFTFLFWLVFRDPQRRIRWAIPSFLLLLAVFYKDISLFFEPYRGSSSGLSVTLLDAPIIALTLFVWQTIRWDGIAKIFLAFLFWSLLGGLFVAARKDFFFFEFAKHIRVIFFYLLLLSYFSSFDRQSLEKLLIQTLLAFCWIQLFFCLHQRMTGVYRLRGTFEHSNTLSIMINMVTPLLFVKLFSCKTKKEYLSYGLALGGCCAAVIMTRSRAGWIILGGGLVGAYGLMWVRGLLSRLFPQRATSTKEPFPSLRLTLLLACLGGLMLLKFLPAMLERIAQAPKSSAAARDHHNDQCKELAQHYPLGVGLNQYVHAQIHLFGQHPEDADTTVAHHLYWLIAGETGYIGLLLFSWLPLTILFWMLRGLLIAHALAANAILLGISTAFLQSFAEPVLRQQRSMLLCFFFMAFGLALTKRALYEQRAPSIPSTLTPATTIPSTAVESTTPPEASPSLLPTWARPSAPLPSRSWRNNHLTKDRASTPTEDPQDDA